MILEQLPFILIISLLNTVLFVALLLSFSRILKKQQKINKYKDSVEKHYLNNLDAINTESEKILADLNEHYEALLGHSEDTAHAFKEQLHTWLNQVKKHNAEEVEQVSRELEAKMEAIFKDQITSMIKEYQLSLDNQKEKEMEKIKQELTEYRLKKFDELDQKINAKVVEIAKEVLPKSISLQDQEQLIITYLEQIRGDKVLE